MIISCLDCQKDFIAKDIKHGYPQERCGVCFRKRKTLMMQEARKKIVPKITVKEKSYKEYIAIAAKQDAYNYAQYVDKKKPFRFDNDLKRSLNSE